MMGKLEHEFQEERVGNALKSEERLRMLIEKCRENGHDSTLFNALRKRAIAARQELVQQREAAGMAKNSQHNAETIQMLFPIPPMM
jgi:hypothetical protein